MEETNRRDSIARVDQIRALEAARQVPVPSDVQSEAGVSVDSPDMGQLSNELGDFALSAVGEAEEVILENEVLKLTFSTQGGRPYTANLTQYQTHDSLALDLFDGDSTIFFLTYSGKLSNSIL